MNSEDKGYLNKNNNAVKDNASGWVLTTSFGASIISGMLIGLLIEYFFYFTFISQLYIKSIQKCKRLFKD